MGYGDEIIASGHALSEYRRTGKLIRIVGADGVKRSSVLWDGLPWIEQPNVTGRDVATLRNGPTCRPYMSAFSIEAGATYSGWRVRDHVGAISFRSTELEAARMRLGGWRDDHGYVIIEPNISAEGNPNKQWGFHRWQALADIWRKIPNVPRLLQLGHPEKTHWLHGVATIETMTFRDAAAILFGARAAVLPEGGLHHAAGVMRIPAVVLFGGSVDADAMGYDWHYNVSDRGDDRTPCGRWKPCTHCAETWVALPPREVAAALESVLG